AAKTTGVRYALILPNQNAFTTGANTVWQVHAPLYAYYLTVSQNTAGYPASDTAACPAIKTATNLGNTCQWQLFDKKYALFYYAQLKQLTTQNFATRDPFYTRWIALGGVSGLGPANTVEATLTSSFATAATGQTFDQGAIYNITSGTLTGRLVAVREPVYDLYAANGGPTGPLGLPVSDDLLLPSGLRRQSFEGGSIDFDPATGVATLRPAITLLQIQPGGSITMNLGDTRTLQASVFISGNVIATDRVITWNTSNNKVVTIQPNGLTAAIKAVGGGSAVITITAEGKTSTALSIFVAAPCCDVGEGAPTSALRQAFQDAVTRNRIAVETPVAQAVTRVGNGYIQQIMTADAAPQPVLIAAPDGSAGAFAIDGAILAQYLALGGPAGALGYPTSDATVAGRQTFKQGALAGTPVQLVSGAILTKWAAFGYESGVAGLPISAASQYLTFRATSGFAQNFQTATIVAPNSGPQAGRTFIVTGLVLAKYAASGGPGGTLGAPVNDEFASNGRHRQDFEGGFIDYAAGDATANVVPSARQPLVTATPASVLAGSRVRLAVGGFNNGDTVRVSITGQPDFTVKVASGAYVWDAFVPATAKSGAITIRATQTSGTLSATANYNIVATSEARLLLATSSGDAQTGAPGAVLPQPLRITVTDTAGNPAPGQVVTFAASQGAVISPTTATTDASGQAFAMLRLPMSEGLALATATTARQVVTFSARAQAFSLTNFPALSQAFDATIGNSSATIRQRGALLAAVAGMLRYRQTRGELASPNGLADAFTLNAFLTAFCVTDSQGKKICDGFVGTAEPIVNLWRVAAFAGGAVDVSLESFDVQNIRDLVAGGSPVLLALSLPTGTHFVVAVGVNENGNVLVADSNSPLARPRLDDYLALQARITGAVRLIPRVPSSPGFLITAAAAPRASFAGGSCGNALGLSNSQFFLFCDGTAPIYQLDLGSGTAAFTDLAPGGTSTELSGAPTSLKIVRSGAQWVVAPLDVTFSASTVLNAATFTGDFSPGGLISIFGAGFVAGQTLPRVKINDTAPSVLAALPFQINAQIPLNIPAGNATLSISAGNSTLSQP
ncbi:MAG TPA: Ig-like domain-containing protein, partial [Bryobacteraceae bacterium]|nr:Ig-like domain-containing protein [Bryobacteraceae bacterium]